ncbi:MAG: hypothetical protein JWM68_336 [Verrucomicrobiales bacterium]|nr:hypothetical protein [Verrucomicrobiales bacterium]
MANDPKTAGRIHPVLLLLISGIFLLIGIVFLGGVFKMSYGWWRTRAEVTTEARLVSVDLQATTGKAAATSTIASYKYTVNGQVFTGQKIALFKGTKEFHTPLSSSLRSGTPIRVFIDPQDPSFAVIDREFVWGPISVGVLLVLVFGGGGVMCLYHLIRRPKA